MDPSTQQVSQFQAGEIAAFEALYDAESPRLGRFIRRYIRSADTAEDVFQEIWIRVWEKRQQLRDAEKFTSWFFQIARNTIFEEMRRRRQKIQFTAFGELEPEEAELVLSLASQAEAGVRRNVAQREWRTLIDEEIQRLDPVAAEMLSLRFGADLSLREVAETMGVPLGTVCAKTSRSLKRLKTRLEERAIDADLFNF